jgi:hypothetical protein
VPPGVSPSRFLTLQLMLQTLPPPIRTAFRQPSPGTACRLGLCTPESGPASRWSVEVGAIVTPIAAV